MPVNQTNVVLTHDVPWTFRAKASEQKATATLRYKDDFDGWATRCPLFGAEHPDLPGMFLTEIAADREGGDQIAVLLTYESSDGALDYPGRPEGGEVIYRYAADITDGEDHILTASIYGDNLSATNLKALMAIANGSEQKSDGSNWADDVTGTLALGALAKIRKGVIARKSYSLFWVEKFTTSDLSDLNFTHIHKTEVPPGGVGGAAVNWLYVGASATETDDGGFYALERRWQYSPDGWDADLYPAAP